MFVQRTITTYTTRLFCKDEYLECLYYLYARQCSRASQFTVIVEHNNNNNLFSSDSLVPTALSYLRTPTLSISLNI